MAVFQIISTIITLFILAMGDDQILSIELSLPDILTTFTNIDQALRTFQGSDVDFFGGNAVADNILMKVQLASMGELYKLITLQRRLNQMRPNVELGPGSFKTEILTYPPNYYASRLKTLLKIKQKQEEMNKDLNV